MVIERHGALLEALRRDAIGPDQTWDRWPGGWPNEVGTALIDAVYSARATYTTTRGRGVLPLVQQWRDDHTPAERDSLEGLVAEIEAVGALPWATSFGSAQHSPGRRLTNPNEPWKSAAILDAARLLLSESRIRAAVDVTEDRCRDIDRTIRRVGGIGSATSTYFLMLLGHSGVKVDVMITRYVSRALDDGPAKPGQIAAVVASAAAALEVDLRDLEHTIWEFERRR